MVTVIENLKPVYYTLKLPYGYSVHRKYFMEKIFIFLYS
jgi:hypothetical protein